MATIIAVLDANVLYPVFLRDFLLTLAHNYFFQPKWSAEIQDEWKRNVLLERPALQNKLGATQTVMLPN